MFWLSKARARKNPQFRFVKYKHSSNKQRQIFVLFLKLTAVPKKSIPDKFAYIWHFQEIVRNAKKF